MSQQKQTGKLESGYEYEILFPTRYGHPCYEMTVGLPEDVPNIFVDCLLNDLRPEKLLHAFSESQRLRLEGAFSDFYDTYVSDVRRIEFLTVMTPNIMYEIMKLGLTCDIEFVNKRMVVYWPVPVDKHDPCTEMIGAASILTQKLHRILQRFDDLHEATPTDETIIAAREAGTRLENASMEFRRPRTVFQVVDRIMQVALLLSNGLWLIAFLLYTSLDGDTESGKALLNFAVWSVIPALLVLFIALLYFIFVRRGMKRRYTERLRRDYEVARQNLA